MRRLSYYLSIWWRMSKNSFIGAFHAKIAFTIFLLGKILRFVFFAGFLFFLIKGSNNLAGYSVNQAIFFFLTFNFIDIMAQFLFREVYRFRPMIVSGDFDLVLTKPFSALFRVLLGGADMIDLVTIPPLFVAMYWFGLTLSPNLANSLLYLLLLVNGLFIATAFHIAALGLGIVTLEIDHSIMIYRDLMSLGRFPIDIYREPLKSVLTYLVPVGLMITVPAKALMGLVTLQGVFLSFGVAMVAIFLSLRFWHLALRYYTSASS